MTDIILSPGQDLAALPQDHLDALADFVRLNVANGDAKPDTIRNLYSRIKTYTAWAETSDINPVRATDDDIKEYRAWLVDQGYAPSTIAAKLNAIRTLFAAAVWRGYRLDNPAKGVRAKSDKSDPADKVKFLPLSDIT